MQRTNAFEVEGLVAEVFQNGTCRIELTNGHRLCGFMARKRGQAAGQVACGDRVRVRLTPYDLSVGRIVSGND